MTSTLLVLLASELVAPFPAEFRAVVTEACGGVSVEVSTGVQAPPGRNVAWISPTGPNELELVLHTSRIAGDLRRVLRFAPNDAPRERARAAAFTLASMLRERDADLSAGSPTAPPTTPTPSTWLLDVSAGGMLSVAGANPGANLSLDARRAVFPWLHLGVGAQLALLSAPGASTLVQPAVWAEAGLCVDAGNWRPAVLLGGGAMLSSFFRQNGSLSVAQPFLRIAVEARYALDASQGLRAGLWTHLAPDTLTLLEGTTPLGVAGPAWLGVEVGYVRTW